MRKQQKKSLKYATFKLTQQRIRQKAEKRKSPS